MAKGMFNDRRMGFTADVNGEFTLKNAKVGATNGNEEKGEKPFIYVIAKSVKGGRSVFVGAGDLQALAIERKLTGNKLPFIGASLDTEVESENLRINESFTFAIQDKKLTC